MNITEIRTKTYRVVVSGPAQFAEYIEAASYDVFDGRLHFYAEDGASIAVFREWSYVTLT